MHPIYSRRPDKLTTIENIVMDGGSDVQAAFRNMKSKEDDAREYDVEEIKSRYGISQADAEEAYRQFQQWTKRK